MDKEDAADVSVEDPGYVMLKAAKILEQKFQDRFPGIKGLAFSCNVSVSKLKRDFKEVHGITPLEYFRTLQVRYALDIVKKKEKTLKEIATELGFRKSSSFLEWYKKSALEKEIQHN
ncbi:helix-turn-helix domain-containing protein [Mucilaginibacter sp.]|uniref:helix-turn-helix domain-containing protein n=1 Tax=Mucilaginibacter sp. TaxID=1882438 RepID=UPI0028515343|nr:helix-turn-helix domain-containing protein [Mucilaginibacter sp.]MDR3697772.1 helix-turn-helix domain-containing protein [Mucilaginibacter sp.]